MGKTPQKPSKNLPKTCQNLPGFLSETEGFQQVDLKTFFFRVGSAGFRPRH
jgi:hypothetical protein